MIEKVLMLSLMCLLAGGPASYGFSRPCFAPEQAASHAGKDICIAAHVYGVEQAADGTRLLNVCGPVGPAAGGEQVLVGPPEAESAGTCALVVVSLAEDRRDVGTLSDVQDKDVRLRGTIHSVHGQSILLLSNARQFHDGPEKFRPNPELLRGFSAEEAATAFRDPNMSSRSKHSRSSTFAGKLTPVH